MDIIRCFETPLIIDELPDHSRANEELRQAIMARRNLDPSGRTVSNLLGWHSDLRMLDWGGRYAKKLAEHAIKIADKYTQDIGSDSGGRYAWVLEMWANISGRGASNQYHCHAGAFWAAVYYVDDGYGGLPNRSLGGELEVEDPRMPMILMDGPDLRMRSVPDEQLADPEVRIRPSAGKLLIFPGWLRHGVRPYLGAADRISIAINLTPVRVA